MNKSKRQEALLPNGIPRYVRCYNYDGMVAGDNYTVVYTGHYRKKGDDFLMVCMSANPIHPQGIGQHGYYDHLIDVNKWGWPPSIGRKNHLGKRINFSDLSIDCRTLVLQDYRELWSLEFTIVNGKVMP